MRREKCVIRWRGMTDELQKMSAAQIAVETDIKKLGAGAKVADAAAIFYKTQDATERAQEAQEYKLRMVRQAGKVLASVERSKGGRGNSRSRLASLLDDAGISDNTGITWQKVYRIPEDKFEAYFPEAEYREEEFTIAGLMKHSGLWLGRSDTAEWETPENLFRLLDEEFSFEIDVCASEYNAKVRPYFDKETDGLKQEWGHRTCWMNPPYGREIPLWMNKASQEVKDNNALVVCLVPARTDTEWWWSHCIGGEVRFLRGRLKFSGQSGAPFPSAVVVLGRKYQEYPTVVWWSKWPG